MLTRGWGVVMMMMMACMQARRPAAVQQEGGLDSSSSPVVSLLEALLPTLEGSILPTHRCKYVQFLLFYLTTLNPAGPQQQQDGDDAASAQQPSAAAMRLLSHLCRLVRSEAVPVVLRQNAASYVASFLARSKALSGREVAGVLVELLRDAEAYVQQHERRQEQQRRWSRGYYYDEDEEQEQMAAAGAVVVTASGRGAGGAPARAWEEEEEKQHLVFYSVCQVRPPPWPPPYQPASRGEDDRVW